MGWPSTIDLSISPDGWRIFAVCINCARLIDVDVFVLEKLESYARCSRQPVALLHCKLHTFTMIHPYRSRLTRWFIRQTLLCRTICPGSTVVIFKELWVLVDSLIVRKDDAIQMTLFYRFLLIALAALGGSVSTAQSPETAISGGDSVYGDELEPLSRSFFQRFRTRKDLIPTNINAYFSQLPGQIEAFVR